MSQRRFPDFLTAYKLYSDDGFIPPQFNMWSCLSIIAAALERRVWLPWNDTFSYYPNIYVLLVSMPGDGKSVALNKAVDILQEVNRKTSQLSIMPNQVTEAKFIELMGHGRSFIERAPVLSEEGAQIGERELTHFQNAGYYFASEASNSLRNIFGDFIACLTDFYDCPTTWERATKKDGKKIALKNVCMNILAGSTFDYLGKLVNDENIMGGFASRLIYVVSRNKVVNAQEFQLGGLTPDERSERQLYRAALVQDLIQISRLVGPMHADRDFGQAWEKWYPDFERKRRALESERSQSIMARTNTNVLKVAMLLSASESDDRRLKMHHWEKALQLVTEIQSETSSVFREARANSTSRANSNITLAILHLIEKRPGISIEQVKAILKVKQFNPQLVDSTVQALLEEGGLSLGNTTAGVGSVAIISRDADNYL